MNATRTFKIGEYCAGGIITAEVKGETIHIINKQWNHSAGDRRSSNQRSAEEIHRLTVEATDPNAEMSIDNYLNQLTTVHYADQVLKWVKSKITLARRSFNW